MRYLVELQGETEKKLAERAALKADLLGVRARLSQQRYQLLTLRDTSNTQKESLNRLLGRDLATDFSVEAQTLPAAEEIDPAAAHAVALRHQYRVAASPAANGGGPNAGAPPACRVHS